MQKYKEGSAVKIVSGVHKGKDGYIDRYSSSDDTYLIIDGIPETIKFRVDCDDIEYINSNYLLNGFNEEVVDTEESDVVESTVMVDATTGEVVCSAVKAPITDADVLVLKAKIDSLDAVSIKGRKVEYTPYRGTLCFSCLRDCDDIKVYTLHQRRYGSTYDGMESKLQLCGDCRGAIDEGLEKVFYENPTYTEYWEDYLYEDVLRGYLALLPLQGQELFDNQIVGGWTPHKLDSQDWLDIETEIANDSVYKRNGLYSPSEVNAYRERYPKCKHTYIKVFEDGSAGGRCSKHSGVFGEKDGSANDYNVSSSCYYCTDFELRDTPIKTKEVKKVELKEVAMFEYFCPTCGNKQLLYKDKILGDNIDFDFCSKCCQEIAFDTDELWNEYMGVVEEDCLDEAILNIFM